MARLWISHGGGEPRLMENSPAWLVTDAGDTVAVDLAAIGQAVGLAALVTISEGSRELAGLFIIPGPAPARVTVNGRPADVGFTVLHQRDEVSVRDHGLRFWVAAAAPERASFEPTVHGSEVYCTRTRRRLAPGDQVVRCPGTDRRACGLLYAAEAWELNVRCSCGFDPGAPEWLPPFRPASRGLSNLLRLARAGS